jgi:hypothetical protein
MIVRTPLRQHRAAKQKVSITQTFPAPIGGWNARDGLASMKPTDAVVLNNWYCRPSYVEFRGGYASHATGMADIGKTLAVYNKLTGTNEMFCYTADGIYDVSSAGAVGAIELARTDGKHQWTMFGDGTSNWLIAVNGVDKPAYYDGTTWTAVTNATTPALTGYTGNAVENFIGVVVFKGRLIFIEETSLSFWYLTAGAAGGALTEFDISGECPKGGYLMAAATWTRDAGSGPDDFFVLLTSEGEVIVYQGTNPASAANWAKIGTYTVGKPLGRRCVMQYGGDCVIITENGVFPLSALLQSGDERAKFALSYKIQNAIVDAARSYGSTFGWKAITYPAYDAMLVNIPIAEDGEHQQYVMNLLTKSWSKFTDWDAEDFAVFNGELYFCNGTVVYKAWTGTIDGADDVVYYGKQAFQDFGDARLKHCQLFMPMLAINGNVAYAADIDVDFADEVIAGTVSYSVTSGAVWDVDNWDEAYWASSLEIVRQWSSPRDWTGRWISPKLKIASNAIFGQWMATTLIYEPGDGI